MTMNVRRDENFIGVCNMQQVQRAHSQGAHAAHTHTFYDTSDSHYLNLNPSLMT